MRLIPISLLALLAAFTLASSAGASPMSFKGASSAGEVVVFETDEQVVPGDTDNKRDVYERSYDSEVGIESYVTREVSIGPTGGNDAYNAQFDKINAGGSLVFFSTDEALVEADTDHRGDIYARNLVSGTTTLVSVGESGCAPACGNGPADASFARADADGTK